MSDTAARANRWIRPETLILVVAVTCFAGVIWGLLDANWVLVATEIPAVLALAAVWAFARARSVGSDAAKAAAAIGLACAVEVWVATTVFDARGLQLAVIVAVSTAATGGAGALYWLYSRRHRSSVRTLSVR